MCNLKEGVKNVLALITGLLLIVLIASFALDVKNKLEETENTITVSETGTIYTKPDLALVSFSVVTEEKTVAKAMEENTKKMNDVISFIKEQGVEENDLKTTAFNISPRYEWYDRSTYFPSGKRVLVGYDLRQTLEVKIRDLDKIGVIVEGGTSVGANEVSDLQFTVDEQDALKKQAREEAISKAKAKAEELAKQLGVKLVRISSFNESTAIPYYVNLKESALGIGGGGVAPATPQVETGENKIEVQVSITYEIN
ncbi:MAG: SIMPL domain-containing protein [Candidatus Pacebacteria bacterium]|nr:SIMPL domain-containing protein [Candidatus Paceibacterota bacterium]